MKQKIHLFAYLLAFAAVLSACKKEDDKEATPAPTQAVDEFKTIPTSFTQKVMMERYTGEWCVNCPDAAKYIDAIAVKYPTKFAVAGVHQGDWLEIPQLTTLKDHLGGIGGYPRASINRVPAQNTTNGQDGLVVYSRGNWEANVDRLVDQGSTKTAKAGLAIESSITDNKLSIKVHCGFTATVSSDTRLTVYLLEDQITAVKQIGATTNPYIHDNVLRKVITSGLGDAIDMKTGTYLLKEYKDIDISTYKKENVKIVAFVNTIGGSSNAHQILNVQQAKAGVTQKYD